ncbi:MAG: flippase-like domain-containing protein [Proteobacteria bacterium]|nr:flippase-like domain-containing protein [Pseudomonadota bacterium]
MSEPERIFNPSSLVAPRAMAAYAVSACLVVWLVSRLDAAATRQVLASARPGLLFAAAGAICLVPFFASLRWLSVVRTLPGATASLWLALRACMVAGTLNSFLPSKGGDAAKVVYLYRRTGMAAGLGTVAVERMADLFMLGLWSLAGGLVSGEVLGFYAAAFFSGGALAGGLVICALPEKFLSRFPRVNGRFMAFRQVFLDWYRKPGAVAYTVLSALGVWVVTGGSFVLLTLALAPDGDWQRAMYIYPLGVLAGLIPVTISGIGTRDAAFVALLGSSFTREQATLISLSYTILAYWLISVVSAPVAIWELHRLGWRKKPEKGTP